MLKTRDMTAGDIADQLSVSKSTLSGHFNVLKASDLVTTRRDGTTITYQLNTSVVEELMGAVAALFGRSEITPGATDLLAAKEENSDNNEETSNA